jgi:uncharacterized protein with HEPN domain
MDRKTLNRIADMVEYLDFAIVFAKGSTIEILQQDRMRYSAIGRELHVVGEAAKHVPEVVRNQYPEIPWAKITGLRDHIAHNYAGLDVSAIHETATVFAPQVVIKLRAILKKFS